MSAATPQLATPWRPFLRGHWLAHGCVFELSHCPAHLAAAAVLRHWDANARLYRFGDLLIHLFGTPRMAAAEAEHGYLLTELAGAFVSAALTNKERKAIDAPSGSIALVLGGVVQILQPGPDCAVDPAAWLDLSAYHALMLRPWAAPALPPLPLPPPARSSRELAGVDEAKGLGDFLDAVDDAQKHPAQVKPFFSGLRDALTRLPPIFKPIGNLIRGVGSFFSRIDQWLKANTPQGTRPARQPSAADIRLQNAIRSSFGVLAKVVLGLFLLVLAPFIALFDLLAKRRNNNIDVSGNAPGGGKGKGGAGAPRTIPKPAGGGPSLMRRTADRVSMFLYMKVMARFLGRQHAAYLNRMMQMFERGDLDAALRHAIPLNRMRGMQQLEQMRNFSLMRLLNLRPRTSLQIRTAPSRASAQFMPFAQIDLFKLLQAKYRASFEQLAAAGRHKEAAFVLAELLDEPDAAAKYLVDNGFYREAAELAEGRGLSPALAISLWFIAQDMERALLLAKRTGEFATAHDLLVKRSAPLAKIFRAHWIDVLQAMGAHEQVLRVMLKESTEPEELTGPFDRALEALLETQPTLEGSLLADLLLKAPQHRERLAERADTFLRTAEPTDAPDLQRFVRWLLEHKGKLADHEATLRIAARRLLTDVGQAIPGWNQSDITRLRAALPTRALAADMPREPDLQKLIAQQAHPLKERAEPLEIRITGEGLLPIHDAVLLPGGRWLLALGEIGMRLTDSRGRTLATFKQPAHELIPGDNPSRLLAIGHFDNLHTVTRVHLDERRAEEWFTRMLTLWTPTYDGLRWGVVQDQTFWVLDATAPGLQLLQPAVDLKAQPLAIGGHKRWAMLLVDGAFDVVKMKLYVAAPTKNWQHQGRSVSEDWRELREGTEVFALCQQVAIRYDCFMLGIRPAGLINPGAGPQLLLGDQYALPFDISLAGPAKEPPEIFEYATPVLGEQYFALPRVGQNGSDVQVWDYNPRFESRPRAVYQLGGRQPARVRLQDPWMILCDHAGRAVAIDTRTGHPVAQVQS